MTQKSNQNNQQKKSQWKDMCPSIKPTDSNYQQAQNLVFKTGCKQQNDRLTQCLKFTKKDFRACSKETMELASCLKKKQIFQ